MQPVGHREACIGIAVMRGLRGWCGSPATGTTNRQGTGPTASVAATGVASTLPPPSAW
jgi:hypothetical protein